VTTDLAADQLSKALFRECQLLIPSGRAIADAAITDALVGYDGDIQRIKENFSVLINDVQIDAYRLYQAAESDAAGKAIMKVMRPLVAGTTADDAFSYLSGKFAILDRFSLSLTQSRRSRAGTAFEVIMSRLLDVLGYPYVPQPKLVGSNPDYVMPSLERYGQYATDCIILTCKRTLRERWRQIVTEGSTGTTFFLATIDDKISGSELDIMKSRNVVVVVPEGLRLSKYAKYHNVISFESFFLHHLDPAMARWTSKGVI
jgi:hypothetical protein